MEELFGIHKQDFDEVRRLCLICHGLDRTSDVLFSDSNYNCASDNTRLVFHNLTSGMLLSLAVAIRINIYQNNIISLENDELRNCGSYYLDNELVTKQFPIKDVCDKIIHANLISKVAIPLEITRGSKVAMQFRGKHRGKSWTLDLSIEHFAEAVLNLLDELERNSPNKSQS